MPEIPRFIIERDAPGPGNISVPRIRQSPQTIQSTGEVGTAIARAGANIFEITSARLDETIKKRTRLAQQEAKAKDMGKAIALVLDSRAKAEAELNESQLKDPLNHANNTQKILGKNLQELNRLTGEQITSPEIKLFVEEEFFRFGKDVIPKAREFQTKKVHENISAVSQRFIDEKAKQGVMATSPQDLETARKDILGATRTLVALGVLSEPDGLKKEKDELSKLDEARAISVLNRDPGAFLISDVIKTYPLIDDPDKYNQLINKAAKESERREKDLQEQSKAIRQTLIDTLETRAVSITGNLLDEELDAHVANNDIDPEDATKLRKLRDNSRIRRETDSVVFVELQREALVNPGTEVKTKILNHSRLASEDKLKLLQFTKSVETAQSDPSHFSNTPDYKFASKAIEQSVKGGIIFDPLAGERETNAQLELRRRVEKGEDPVKIMPEIIEKWKRGPLPKRVGGPRFPDEDALTTAFEKKLITKEIFKEEAKRLRNLDGGADATER